VQPQCLLPERSDLLLDAGRPHVFHHHGEVADAHSIVRLKCNSVFAVDHLFPLDLHYQERGATVKCVEVDPFDALDRIGLSRHRVKENRSLAGKK
jgi:hypothetical protein